MRSYSRKHHPSKRRPAIPRLSVLLLIAAGLVVAPAAPSTAATYSTGTYVAGGASGGCPTNHTCASFTIKSCPDGLGGTIPDLKGFRAVAEPAPGTTYRGVLVLFTGGSGTYYWSYKNTSGTDFVESLRSQGFRIVQVKWNDAWTKSAQGKAAGPARIACRPATAIEQFRKAPAQGGFYTTPANAARGKCGFCVAGASGGSAAVAYALSFYGMDSSIDAIFPIGGPTHAAITPGCMRPRGYEQYGYDGPNVDQIDRPYGFVTTIGPCEQKLTGWEARWNQDSVDGSLASDFFYDDTRIHIIVGELDLKMQMHAGDYIRKLQTWGGGQGTPMLAYEVIPGMEHGIRESPAGMAAFKAAVLLGDTAKFNACNNGIDDDRDSKTDHGGGDPGCSSSSDGSERAVGSTTLKCDNAVSDDQDNRVDSPEDAGCLNPSDDAETSGFACDDAVDNNGDGKTDYPADPACSGVTDDTEGSAPPPPKTLAVTVNGPGTVTGAGIDCPGDCTETYADGTSVTLTAAPDTDKAFVGWTQACSGTATTCTLTMNAERSVTATFGHTLTVSVTSNGDIASTPTGIACPGDCAEAYADGASVGLTAVPDAGHSLSGWGGACAGETGTTCTVSMTQNRAVTAEFVNVPPPQHSLTVDATGPGEVTSNPGGISCPGDCTQDYDEGSSVTLTANPNAGKVVTAWGGACSGQTGTSCTVTMSEDKSTSVTFGEPPQHTLTVQVTGPGSVASTPAGIACETDCTEDYDEGTPVTLTATPDGGKSFTGWTDCPSPSGATCSLTMSGDRTVTAAFGETPPPTVTVTGKTAAYDSVDRTVYTTAQVTPGANKLMLLTLWARGTVTEPTVSGNGLTWVREERVGFDGVAAASAAVYRAMGPTPTQQAISITFNGTAATGLAWSLVEVGGVSSAGQDGSDAIAQSVAAAGSGTTGEITLLDLASPANATFAAFGHAAAETTTPETEYTEIHDVFGSGPLVALQTEWRAGEDLDDKVSATWTTASAWRGIALELRAGS